MQRVILISLLLISILVKVHAQGWEYRMGKDHSIFPYQLVELENSELLIGYLEGQFNDTIFSYFLHKIDAQGNFIDSAEFTWNFPSYRFRGYYVTQFDSSILVLGGATNGQNVIYPGIIKLDFDLKPIWDSIFINLPSFYFDFISEHNDTGFVIGGYNRYLYWDYNTIWNTDLQFNMVNQLIDSTVIAWNHCHKSFNPKNDFFYCSSNYEIYQFDRKIPALLSSYRYGQYTTGEFKDARSVAYVTKDNSLLIPGTEDRALGQYKDFDLFLIKFKPNLSVINTFVYENHNIDEISAYVNSVVEMHGNYYLGGSYNIDRGSFVIDKMFTSGFMMIKLDTELNVKWVKRFRNEVSYSMFNFIKSTDNGFVMSGYVWDWKADPNRYVADLYVLKVDSNGNYVGVNEIENPSSTFKVYPNPSNGVLNVSFETNHTSVQLDFIEIQGSIVHSWTFSNTSSEIIDLSTYANGIYLLRATTDNSIETVRVVKSLH